MSEDDTSCNNNEIQLTLEEAKENKKKKNALLTSFLKQRQEKFKEREKRSEKATQTSSTAVAQGKKAYKEIPELLLSPNIISSDTTRVNEPKMNRIALNQTPQADAPAIPKKPNKPIVPDKPEEVVQKLQQVTQTPPINTNNNNNNSNSTTIVVFNDDEEDDEDEAIIKQIEREKENKIKFQLPSSLCDSSEMDTDEYLEEEDVQNDFELHQLYELLNKEEEKGNFSRRQSIQLLAELERFGNVFEESESKERIRHKLKKRLGDLKVTKKILRTDQKRDKKKDDDKERDLTPQPITGDVSQKEFKRFMKEEEREKFKKFKEEEKEKRKQLKEEEKKNKRIKEEEERKMKEEEKKNKRIKEEEEKEKKKLIKEEERKIKEVEKVKKKLTKAEKKEAEKKMKEIKEQDRIVEEQKAKARRGSVLVLKNLVGDDFEKALAVFDYTTNFLKTASNALRKQSKNNLESMRNLANEVEDFSSKTEFKPVDCCLRTISEILKYVGDINEKMTTAVDKLLDDNFFSMIDMKIAVAKNSKKEFNKWWVRLTDIEAQIQNHQEKTISPVALQKLSEAEEKKVLVKERVKQLGNVTLARLETLNMELANNTMVALCDFVDCQKNLYSKGNEVLSGTELCTDIANYKKDYEKTKLAVENRDKTNEAKFTALGNERVFKKIVDKKKPILPTAKTLDAKTHSHSSLLASPAIRKRKKNKPTKEPILLVLAAQGSTEMMATLLNSKISDINIQDQNGNSALHIASDEGHTDIVKLLLQRKIEANSANNEGNTALHMAASKGRLDCVEELCTAGVRKHILNQQQYSPLHLATINGHVDVVKKLLFFKMNPTFASDHGSTAIELADKVNNAEILLLLRRIVSNPNEDIETLCSPNANVAGSNNIKRTRSNSGGQPVEGLSSSGGKKSLMFYTGSDDEDENFSPRKTPKVKASPVHVNIKPFTNTPSEVQIQLPATSNKQEILPQLFTAHQLNNLSKANSPLQLNNSSPATVSHKRSLSQDEGNKPVFDLVNNETNSLTITQTRRRSSSVGAQLELILPKKPPVLKASQSTGDTASITNKSPPKPAFSREMSFMTLPVEEKVEYSESMFQYEVQKRGTKNRMNWSKRIITIHKNIISISKKHNKDILERPAKLLLQCIRSRSSPKQLTLIWKFATQEEKYFFKNVLTLESFYSAAWAARHGINAHPYQDRKHPISIFIGTWNMGDASPISSGIASFFAEKNAHDIYVIGVQECAFSPPEGYDTCEAAFFSRLQNYFGKEYVKLAGLSLSSIRLLVLMKKEHTYFVTNVKSGSVPTGVGGVMGNKGGVAVAFNFHETSLCFVNSHLAAHQEKILARHANFRDIVKGLPSKNVHTGFPVFNLIHQFDCLFWCGDLNYRIDMPRSDVVELVQQKQFDTLLEKDQLILEMKAEAVFSGFSEAKIDFAPTYKYERGSTTKYTEEKSRVPSWCDRVLWHVLPGIELQNTSYDCCDDATTSDHHPVRATFTLSAALPEPPRPELSPLCIVITGLHIEKLRFADNEGKLDPCITFFANFFEKPIPVPVKTKTREPRWDDDEIPKLVTVISSFDLLKLKAIKILVEDKTHRQAQKEQKHKTKRSAQGRLSLYDVVNNYPNQTPFSVPLHSQGYSLCGSMKGVVSLKRATKKMLINE